MDLFASISLKKQQKKEIFNEWHFTICKRSSWLVMFHTLLIVAIIAYPPFSIFLALFGLAIQAIVEEFRKDRDKPINIYMFQEKENKQDRKG